MRLCLHIRQKNSQASPFINNAVWKSNWFLAQSREDHVMVILKRHMKEEGAFVITESRADKIPFLLTYTSVDVSDHLFADLCRFKGALYTAEIRQIANSLVLGASKIKFDGLIALVNHFSYERRCSSLPDVITYAGPRWTTQSSAP
jgi:hypothetical protein